MPWKVDMTKLCEVTEAMKVSAISSEQACRDVAMSK